MKKIISIVLAVLMVMITFSCGQKETAAKRDVKAYVNGKVFTSDENNKYATAFVVEDGKFTYVGTDDGAKNFVKDINGAEVVDLQNKRIIPGFVEGHTHMTSMAMYDSLKYADVPYGASEETIMEFMKAYVKTNPNLDFYLFYNLMQTMDLTTTKLDTISKDKPVFCVAAGLHNSYFNSKFQEVAGINKDTKDAIPGQSYYVRDKDGNPTGQIIEIPQTNIALESGVKLDKKRVYDALIEMQKLYHSYGITGFNGGGSLGFNEFDILEGLKQMENDGTLKLHVAPATIWYGHTVSSIDEIRDRTLKIKSTYTTKHIKPGTVKMWCDGTLGALTAFLRKPYDLGKANNYGNELTTKDDLYAVSKMCKENDLNVHIHAIGDQAIENTLDAFEKVGDMSGTKSLVHFEINPKDLIAKAAKLKNFYINMTPQWANALMEEEVDCVGDRRNTYCLLGEPIEAGITINLGADSNGVKEGWDPFVNILFATFRDPKEERLILKGKPISVEQAIMCYTINSAKERRWDDEIGSIAVGKSADFNILSIDIFADPFGEVSVENGKDEADPDVYCEKVFFEGKEVYKNSKNEVKTEAKIDVKPINVLDQFNDKVVERSKEEWAKIHVLEEYAPNNEITGDYDKSLSAKCENGTFVGKMNGTVLTWKGIPFAKQPVGEMRFKRAEAPEPSDKVYEAYHFGKTSMQAFDPSEIASKYEQGEDSLNLNVWSNTTNKDTKKPVLVYIHGGGFALGGTCDPLYNGLSFSTYNPEVLLVTITYRVGMLGLINLSMFPDGDKYSTATNNHLFDQIQALKWIKKNISAFGGDPDNVTISGESAGACSISSLCTMKEAKGLFKKAIPMSGGVGISTKIENTTNLGEALKEEFNVKTVADLQKVPFEKLKEWWSKNLAFYQAYTINDGKNIKINPYEDWEKGLTKDVILMHGRTGNEFRYYQYVFGNNEEVYDAFCDSMHGTCLEECSESHKEDDKKYFEVLQKLGYKDKQLLREYADDKMFNATVITQMDYHTRAGGTGFYYIFNMKYDYPDIGSGHAIDCYYFFGSFDGKRAIGTVEQQKVSRAFQKMFVNLAVNGNPSIDGIEWTKFNNDTRPTMIFEENNVRIVDNPQKERVDLVVKMSKEEPAYAITGELTYFVPYIIKKSPELQELAKAVINTK